MKKLLPVFFLLFFLTLETYAQSGAGYALDFSPGAGYVQIPYSSSLNPTSALSVEAWIHPTAFGTDPWKNSIVSTDSWSSSNGEEGYVLRCGGNGILSFNFATTTSWKEVTSSTSMSTNKWYHVVGTFDGSNIKIYINGMLVGTTAYSGSIKASTHALRIGEMVETSQSRAFNGKIDEVRIWDKALTQAEVRSNMCKKVNGTDPDLLAYYRFDNGSGNTVNDLSGNSHNGTLSTSYTPTWIPSTAYIGDSSTSVYTSSWSTANISLAHPDQDSMYVTNITGSPAGIQLFYANGAPLDSIVPSGLYGFLDDHYWGMMIIGGTNPLVKMNYNYGGYPNIIHPLDLDMAYNTGSGWQAGNMLQTGQTIYYFPQNSMLFILATHTPQIGFHLLNPADSSLQNIQGSNTQMLTFNWGKLKAKTTANYQWMMDNINGNFSQPVTSFSSDNNGADTSFSISYQDLDNLLSNASVSVGNSKYYKWTVKDTTSEVSANDPFYVELKRGTVVSLKSWKIFKGISVYPSVVSDYFIVENTSSAPWSGQLELFDATGKKVISQSLGLAISEKNKIMIGSLPPGTYVVRIAVGGAVFLQKIVVK